MSAAELSAALWREREALDALVYALDVEHLMLSAGRLHRIDRASAEVDRALTAVRHAGLVRATAVTAVAHEWAAPTDATLRQLIDHSPVSLWRKILGDHLTALTELTRAITSLRDENAAQLRSAVRSADEVIATVADQPESGAYTAEGRAPGPGRPASLFTKDL